MAASTTIHVIGSMMIDRVVRVREIPRPGETVAALSAQTFAGGKGANQAAAAAKQGARVRMLGRTGRDGAFIRDALAEAGVRVRAIATDDAVAGAATVMVAESGENAIVIAPESNLRITKDAIEGFLSGAKQGDIVLFQNESALLHEGIALASVRALRVWLNAAPADARLRSLKLEKLCGLIVNETEAETITGESDPRRALEALARRMPGGTAIVTLGAQGAIAAIGSARYAHRGFVVDAVDTVGCGDAFVGAFLAAIAEGKDAAQALARGNAAGALAAMRSGAMRSLPSRSEVDTVSLLTEGTRLKPRPPAEDEGALPATCVGCGYALVGREEGDACTECGRIVRRLMFTGRWTSAAVRRRFAWAWWIAATACAIFVIGAASFMVAVAWRPLSAPMQDVFGFTALGLLGLHVLLGCIAQIGFARGASRVSWMRAGVAMSIIRIGSVVLLVFALGPALTFGWTEILMAVMMTMLALVDAAFVLFLEWSWRFARFPRRRPILAIAGVASALGVASIWWTLESGSAKAPTFRLFALCAMLAFAWFAQAWLARGISRQIRVQE
jgi:ribokinase